MAKWKPKLVDGTDLTSLDLNAEEGFVLSRVDGRTTVDDLTHVTGMNRDQVKGILKKLIRTGAVDRPPPRAAKKKAAVPKTAPAPVPEMDLPVPDLDEPRDEDQDHDEDDEGSGAAAATTPAPVDTGDADDGSSDDGSAEDEAPLESDEDVEDDEGEAVDTGNLRKLFETELHPLDDDVRIKNAQTAEGAVLSAYCFDPNPKVIQSVMQNMKAGLQHARLIAQHHRNAAGLQALAKKSQFLRDRQVQRWLFKNSQLPEALFKAILLKKRLTDVYGLAVSREVTEKVKGTAKRSFRKRFISAPAEEKAILIHKCEGRCLNLLIGVPLDGRTAALLTQRAVHSTLLIQNLARWPTTPPSVLQHLAKQGPVKRQPNLRQLIMRHPNAPAALKAGR